MEWANTPWYILAASAVLMPMIVQFLKRWKTADLLKRVLAFVVSCAVAAGGLLIDDKLSVETLLPNMAVIFMTGMLVYQAFFKTSLGALPWKALVKVVAPGK